MNLIESILKDLDSARAKIISAKREFDMNVEGIIDNITIKIRRNIIIINGIEYRVENLRLEFDNELD